MSYKTRLDFGSNNRQAKQHQYSEIILSGKTTFGVTDYLIPPEFTGDTINIEARQYIKTKGLIIVDGTEQDGLVLTSDANGKATWQSVSSLSGDYLPLSGGTVSGSTTFNDDFTLSGIILYNEVYSNNFSGGTLGSLVNDVSNDVDWIIGVGEGVGGTDCMKSDIDINQQESKIYYDFTPLSEFTKLTFKYKQTMEGYPYDSLRVIINGVDSFHGENTTEWVDVELILTGKSFKNVVFRNYTDYGSLNSPDTVWIDDIKIEETPIGFNVQKNSSFSGNTLFNGPLFVNGKVEVSETVFSNGINSSERIYGNKGIEVNPIYADGEYFVMNFKSEEIVLAPSERFIYFRGGYWVESAATSGNEGRSSVTLQMKLGENTSGYENVNDGLPCPNFYMAKNGKANIYLSAQEKENGASNINSRLQIGYNGSLADQTNFNTLDVNGNIHAVDVVSSNASISDINLSGDTSLVTLEYLTDAITGVTTSVGVNELKPELKSSINLVGLNVDWSTGIQFNYTMTAATELTFSNVLQGKTIMLVIDGNYTLTLPSGVNSVDLVNFDGGKTNYIQIYCADSTTPIFLVGLKNY